MPLDLDAYDRGVGHHLRLIRHHAMNIDTHVQLLQRQPDFQTMAEDDLVQCDAILAEALGRVRRAIETFRGKPRDR